MLSRQEKEEIDRTAETMRKLNKNEKIIVLATANALLTRQELEEEEEEKEVVMK